MKFSKNEEAVSPVIGVILMVAITVILAAVIAAFVFGMAGNVQKTKVIAATAAQQGASTIYVTYQGGPDHVQLASLQYNIAGTTGSLSTLVGTSATAASGTTGQDHVTVTATFNDGSSQVILDTYV
jgi:flagellin-like protein